MQNLHRQFYINAKKKYLVFIYYISLLKNNSYVTHLKKYTCFKLSLLPFFPFNTNHSSGSTTYKIIFQTHFKKSTFDSQNE